MKHKLISLLMALCLLMLLSGGTYAEDLSLPDNKLEMGSAPAGTTGGSLSDVVLDANASLIGSLGKKDWEAKAAAVKRTGNWRKDLVAVAQSQIGYQQPSDGKTLYALWAGYEKPVEEWNPLFINWVVSQASLTRTQIPQIKGYEDIRKQMDKLHALKKVSRSSYPASGDLALMVVDGQKLVGIVDYINNGYATVILGDNKGRITKETYPVIKEVFKYYVDLNVLMERVGIDVGKGGEVPEIPEGGLTGWTNTNAVYIRKEPTTASKNLTTVKKPNTTLLVTSAAMQEDGYVWYGVKYKKYEGYIRGDLLELDLMAAPAATPTPVPTAGCTLCAQAAGRTVDCCYEKLTAMSAQEAFRFMLEMMWKDPASFKLYADCHGAHVRAGAEALLCLGKKCGLAAWTMPSSLHDKACPWHHNGLIMQERVVNVEMQDARAGQQVTVRYEVYGALSYQWHEIRSAMNADGSVTETDVALEGETKDALTVSAKSEANTTCSYYCVATILANGEPTEIRSKTTLLNVGRTPVVAQAILGEEINFTYDYFGAHAYQWYVQADENAKPVAIAADDAAYSGADSAKLTFHAAAENAGALYSCAALGRDGKAIRHSGYFAYAVSAYASAPDVSVCKGHDLCRYVEEMANMTREERYVALTKTWSVSTADITSAADAGDCLAEYVMLHWYMCHQQTYPRLICTCTPADDRLVCHPTEDVHESGCPWYVAPVKTASDQTRRADQEEYDKWAATATDEMIARAQTVETLDHVVFEQKADNTYDVYIVRYAEPVGSVDANGYLTYGAPSLVIAWVDLSTGTLYAMNDLPSHAPVYVN